MECAEFVEFAEPVLHTFLTSLPGRPVAAPLSVEVRSILRQHGESGLSAQNGLRIVPQVRIWEYTDT